MSQVCEGTICKGDEKVAVALKLPVRPVISAERSEYFSRKYAKEGMLLRRLKHPNVIEFVGLTILEDPPVLVLELAPGGSFSAYLQKRGRQLTIKQRVRFCVQAASAMEYLEERLIVHADVAARNFVLTTDELLKLSAFGSAIELLRKRDRAINTSTDHPKPTETEYPIKRLIRWLAPEAIRKCKKHRLQSNQFA